MIREVIIKSDVLSLVKPIENDIDFLFSIKNDVSISSYLGGGSNWSRKEIELYYEKNIKINKNYFAIMSNTDSQLIGFVGLKLYSKQNNNGSLVIFLSGGNVGKGYGTISMKLFMKYCFQELGLHKLKLKVYENNIPAIRLYEKLGFRTIGILKEEVFFDGKYIDKLCMEILKSEYDLLNQH